MPSASVGVAKPAGLERGHASIARLQPDERRLHRDAHELERERRHQRALDAPDHRNAPHDAVLGLDRQQAMARRRALEHLQVGSAPA
jgi:hypothetical protein